MGGPRTVQKKFDSASYSPCPTRVVCRTGTRATPSSQLKGLGPAVSQARTDGGGWVKKHPSTLPHMPPPLAFSERQLGWHLRWWGQAQPSMSAVPAVPPSRRIENGQFAIILPGLQSETWSEHSHMGIGAGEIKHHPYLLGPNSKFCF